MWKTRDLKRTVSLFLYKIMHNDLPPGMGVRKADLDVRGQAAYAAVHPDDVRGAKRVALMVHGFTSDTEWLVWHAWPWAKKHGYDLCLTYDYETFNTGFKENGRMLHEQLTTLGFGPNDGVKLDIFCHSMGTQVSRAMIELWGGEDVCGSGLHGRGAQRWLGLGQGGEAAALDQHGHAQRRGHRRAAGGGGGLGAEEDLRFGRGCPGHGPGFRVLPGDQRIDQDHQSALLCADRHQQRHGQPERQLDPALHQGGHGQGRWTWGWTPSWGTTTSPWG